ncbi:UDP-N-acetylmuramoylalanine--D-glutamate ligase [hydrothermal vent metagenome]|uniref:UDP-N-acetylmuramoylalanine--D-glutamate ligase n=1 Tax=hydrothermal vent metagenome TaxID=652676 RepID=A0A3B0VWM3_9ZZZZ
MYLVAGLGVTGQSVLRYFAAQGEPCLAFDTRKSLNISTLQSQFFQAEFALENLPKSWLKRFDTLVLSPGIAKSEPWVVKLMQQGKQVIGDIELFARTVNAPVIAITGSNGKSTVTTMTGMALQAAGYQVGVGGNIGAPVLDLLLDDKSYEVFVLELSSFQLETTYSLASCTATVLNISEDHMDRYPTMEEYIQAKMQIFSNTELAVLPENFSAQGISQHTPISRFGMGDNVIQSEQDFGLISETKCSERKGGGEFLGFGKTPVIARSDMALKGSHHQLNALAMMALCQMFNVDSAHFKYVVQTFKGLPHRTQLIGTYNDIDWVNDSKGTNIGATLTAIESLGKQTIEKQSKGALVLLLGGVSKEADFSALIPYIQSYCRHTIVFGRDQQRIAQHLIGVDMTFVKTLEEAAELAQKIALQGDCVVFSPACASFDQFANYVQRGDVFTEKVLALHSMSCGDKKC